MKNGFGNPLQNLFRMQLHQAFLEGAISMLLLHID